MTEKRSDLAERIRQARADKGWKQKHLAAAAGVEPITVSRWERGATTPDLSVVRVIAEATEKPLTYFVAGEEERKAQLGLEEAVRRMEAAADRVAAQADRIAGLVDELRRSGRSE